MLAVLAVALLGWVAVELALMRVYRGIPALVDGGQQRGRRRRNSRGRLRRRLQRRGTLSVIRPGRGGSNGDGRMVHVAER